MPFEYDKLAFYRISDVIAPNVVVSYRLFAGDPEEFDIRPSSTRDKLMSLQSS